MVDATVVVAGISLIGTLAGTFTVVWAKDSFAVSS